MMEDDIRASASAGEGEDAPQTAGGPGNEDGLAGQVIHGLILTLPILTGILRFLTWVFEGDTIF